MANRRRTRRGETSGTWRDHSMPVLVSAAVATIVAAAVMVTTLGGSDGDGSQTRTSDGPELAANTDTSGATEGVPPARPTLRVADGTALRSSPVTIVPGSDAGAALDGSSDGSATEQDPSTASSTATAPTSSTPSTMAGTPSSGSNSAAGTDPPSTASPSTASPSTATTSTTPPSTASTSTTPPDRSGTDAGGRFVTLPPGAQLPTGSQCAARVRPTPENVPENRTRNQTRGGAVTGTYLATNSAIAANDYQSRIDGDYVGSTDEIIQWAACKWGFDEHLVRAQVYAESTWYAGKLGDCGESTVPETGGCASVGLIQVRSAERSGSHHPGLYPKAWQSSALNLDYGLAVMRLCFEGLETWLGQTGNYRAGDHGNCMGRWFSGSWADAGSRDYQAKVRDIAARRPWETWVGCRDWQTNNHCAG